MRGDRETASRGYICNFSFRSKFMQIGTQWRYADGPRAELKLQMLDARFSPVILVATLGGPTMFARIGIMRALN